MNFRLHSTHLVPDAHDGVVRDHRDHACCVFKSVAELGIAFSVGGYEPVKQFTVCMSLREVKSC